MPSQEGAYFVVFASLCQVQRGNKKHLIYSLYRSAFIALLAECSVLNVKTEVDNIAVFNDVLFTF
jgi:hypothetical protein